MLDLNALKSFVLVAETLNFTKVAELRNTVQSSVSAQITKLETAVGRTLIIRGRGQSMTLTPEGEAFLAYARRLLTLSEEAVETVRTSQSRRIIRLGTTVTLAMSVVPGVLAAYIAERPDVQIHIQCDRSDALLNRLDTQEIDVAFMMDQGKRSGRAFVHSQSLVWISAVSFALNTDQDVPMAFLSDGRDLRRYALEALDAVGRRGYIAHLSPHPIGVRAFVQSGLALTIGPTSTVASPLQTAASDLGLPPLAPIALAGYRQDGSKSKDADLLLTMLEHSIS